MYSGGTYTYNNATDGAPSATCASNYVILPLHWLNVAATLGTTAVNVTWLSGVEESIRYYEVYRSVDGVNFVYIGKVAAKNNNAASNQYNYADIDALSLTAKNIYYRITAVNINGSKDLSKIVLVKQAGAENKISVYPNPSAGTIWFNSLQDVSAIKIYAYDGSLVKQYANIDASKLQYDLSALSNGNYAIRLIKKSGESAVLNVMLVK